MIYYDSLEKQDKTKQTILNRYIFSDDTTGYGFLKKKKVIF